MRRLTTVFLLALAGGTAFGQINPTVEVTRKFDVSLQDIHKPSLSVAVDDSLHRFDVSFDYSISNRPYDNLYDFIPYEAVRIGTLAPERMPYVAARIGGQYQTAPSAEIYLQGGKRGFYGTLYALHDSFWGDVPDAVEDGVRLDLNRMRNTGGCSLTYDWDTGEFLLDAKYRYDSCDYTRGEAGLMRSVSGADVSANLSSANTDSDGVYYDVLLGYRNLSYGSGDGIPALGENRLSLNGHIGSTFDIHRVYIDMNVQYASYSGAKEFSSGVVEFSPIYQLDRNRLSAKLGLKFGNRYGLESGAASSTEGLDTETNFFPNVDARYELVRNGMWIHATVGGGNDLNSFSDLQKRMPLLDSGCSLLFGKRSVDSRLSVESLLFGRLAVNLAGGWTLYENRLFFAPSPLENGLYAVNAAYMDMNTLFASAQVMWSSEFLDAGCSFRYNRNVTSADVAVTEFPAFEADGHVRYNFRERVSTSLDFRCTGAVSGSVFCEYSVPAVVDLDLNMAFAVNRHITVYVKCGNLLDRRNQYMPLYVEPGRNFGGGVCLNF